MATVKMKCKRGHSFSAYVANKYSKVECPECKRLAQSSDSSFMPSMVETVIASDFWSSGSSDSYSSGDSFSSGGGGDFGGGGASGSWD